MGEDLSRGTVLCPDCGSHTRTSWDKHYCYARKNGVLVGIVTKKWDVVMQAWRVVEEEKEDSTVSTAVMVTRDNVEYEVASCELPVKKVLGPAPGSYVSSYTSSYKRLNEWHGLDHQKWPRTYYTLMMFYFHKDVRLGKYISDEDFKLRLQGVYKPEPKYTTFYRNDPEDWENHVD